MKTYFCKKVDCGNIIKPNNIGLKIKLKNTIQNIKILYNPI